MDSIAAAIVVTALAWMAFGTIAAAHYHRQHRHMHPSKWVQVREKAILAVIVVGGLISLFAMPAERRSRRSLL